MRWHEAAIERHQAELAALQDTRRQLAERLAGGGSAAEGQPPAGLHQQAADGVAGLNGTAGNQAQDSSPGSPDSQGEVHPPVTGRAVMQLQRGTASELEEVEAKASDEAEWGAVLQVRRWWVVPGSWGCLHECMHTRSACNLLRPSPCVPAQAVHTGLLSGRRLIWEEAARRIGVLLSSPAAFEGEHFLQVGWAGGGAAGCGRLPGSLVLWH